MQVKKQQLEPYMEHLIGSKSGKEYDKAVYCQPVYLMYIGFPGGTSGKEPACLPRRHKRWGLDPWIEKTPWRRAWQPTPVFARWGPCPLRRLKGSPGFCPDLRRNPVLWRPVSSPRYSSLGISYGRRFSMEFQHSQDYLFKDVCASRGEVLFPFLKKPG